MFKPDEEREILLQLYDALHPLKVKFEKVVDVNYLHRKAFELNVEQAQILYPLYESRFKEILTTLEHIQVG